MSRSSDSIAVPLAWAQLDDETRRRLKSDVQLEKRKIVEFQRRVEARDGRSFPSTPDFVEYARRYKNWPRWRRWLDVWGNALRDLTEYEKNLAAYHDVVARCPQVMQGGFDEEDEMREGDEGEGEEREGEERRE